MEFVTCWGPDPKIRLEKSIELAKQIGARVIVVHPQDYLDRGFYKWTRENFPKIITGAKPATVAFENHTTRRRLSDKKFFTIFPSYTLDTSHIATTQKDPAETARKIGSKLFHVHLSDSDFKRRPNRPDLIADRHLLPGQGKLPLREFLQTLKEIEYSNYIVLEVLPENVGAGESDQTIVNNLKKARKFIEENLS